MVNCGHTTESYTLMIATWMRISFQTWLLLQLYTTMSMKNFSTLVLRIVTRVLYNKVYTFATSICTNATFRRCYSDLWSDIIFYSNSNI